MNKTWIAIAVALVGAPACGGKSKPAETTEEVTETKPEPKPAPETDQTPPPVNEERQVNLSGPIYFDFDKFELREEARDKLQNNFEWLQKNPQSTLTIEGHTDEVGTNEYNIGLGERRARAARDYLIRLGADAKRVRIISYGEERPAQTGNDEVNRRDEFQSQ